MMFGHFDTPQELSEKYGFVCHTNRDGSKAVFTASGGIELDGEQFVGQFIYGKDDSFHYCMLAPITDITDNYQRERKVLTEFHICDKVISDIGKRIGQFEIDIVEIASRDAPSVAEKYVLFIKEHPFFTEIYGLLKDSSMTNEELTNFIIHIENAISKYKDTF